MMKSLLLMMLLAPACLMPAQSPDRPPPPATLRAILLEQLHTMHDREEWYAPLKVATEGLTPEQARWVPGPGQHSVGMLVNHLVLWNGRDLARFRGANPPEIKVNDETFNSFDGATWPALVRQLDSQLTEWEREVEKADDAKLAIWASTIAHIATHNAYHTGQIVLVRKLQGYWNPDKGVK